MHVNRQTAHTPHSQTPSTPKYATTCVQVLRTYPAFLRVVSTASDVIEVPGAVTDEAVDGGAVGWWKSALRSDESYLRSDWSALLAVLTSTNDTIATLPWSRTNSTFCTRPNLKVYYVQIVYVK